jgi:ATP-dependent DNA ligase
MATRIPWIFEIKWDGFRALLFSDKEHARLVSRNGNRFKSFPGRPAGFWARAFA